MGFISDLQGTPIIETMTDVRNHRTRHDERMQALGRGYVCRDKPADPNNPAELCLPFPDELRIPESDWEDIIEMREKTNSTLKERSLLGGIETISQGPIPHCWAYGCVRAGEIVDVCLHGDTHIPRSPTAVACLARGFRKVGGNTFHAIPVMAEKGVPPVSAWPLHKIDRRYDTPEVWAQGQDGKLKQWYELPSNDFNAMASMLLRGFPVIIGLMWWGHMVCATDLRKLDGRGRFGTEIWNSHGKRYGNNGFAVLSRQKSTAFDQVAPVTVAT